jgi:hypothetical protein
MSKASDTEFKQNYNQNIWETFFGKIGLDEHTRQFFNDNLSDKGLPFFFQNNFGEIEGYYRPIFMDPMEDLCSLFFEEEDVDINEKRRMLEDVFSKDDFEKIKLNMSARLCNWVLMDFMNELPLFLEQIQNDAVEKIKRELLKPLKDSDDFTTSKTASEITKKLTKNLIDKKNQIVKRKFNIKRGGSKKKRGFSWTEERKINFFKTVEDLPKVKTGKTLISIWEFALYELIEQEFDIEVIRWIKSHPQFRDVPDNLYIEAIKTWKKYLLHENWNEMKKDEKPLAFKYRHAIHKLDYPDSYKFSGLKTIYYTGKSLVKNQNKT